MAHLSTNWPDGIDTTISEYTQDGFQEHTDWSGEIFDITDGAFGVYRYKDSFGPGMIPQGSQGSSSTELEMADGYKTTIAPVIFKAKMSISEELVRWNNFDDLFDMSRALGSAAIQTINRYFANIFINALTWKVRLKSILIDLESQRWETGGKQEKSVQPERLSEWTYSSSKMRQSVLQI